ncbi:hypothetical protein PY479_04020 [Shewanella sp. A32]|uniref:hypothetical protein n=1 Tax=Shewanella sp. A32 TaxID=3031327 RepID=UPI0023B8F225|nr:hypothetical protein [Shewanella sp. A32]MDF0533446.1 hypothetical protein [Shewanella sp. A32]
MTLWRCCHFKMTWNLGDIKAHTQGYWPNDKGRFVSGKRCVSGWTAILSTYQQNYLDKKTMG